MIKTKNRCGKPCLAPSLNINELVRGFVNQLLQALLALHEYCIVHCDVKGDNIFIANKNGHYIVKLGVSLIRNFNKKTNSRSFSLD